LRLRKKVGVQNWLDQGDLKNILELSGFEVINSYKRFLGITTVTIAEVSPPSPRLRKDKEYSVSIIIPARNEEGNIARIIPSIPRFGKWQEIIFVEGGSRDKTWGKIMKEVKRTQPSSRLRRVKAFKQKLKGKSDAVWMGFEKAKGDVLIIYDADRTVNASDLLKFFYALVSRPNTFINGSRMIYPMEQESMKFLNRIGNKTFSYIFTWILGQRFKDTLCGTKALFRKDYLYMRKHNKKYFEMDPFGDFALIFGAIKNNLKVTEIPVRYKEREYGSTNINRFRHGFVLLKMAIVAFVEFKL
jgi:glycosyltransferase involved in cell wall biosynthesis